MTDLSPAARAVWEAAMNTPDHMPYEHDIAAALLAAADQVAPEDFAYDSGSLADGALEFEQGQDCRNEAIRRHILAIAAELKNHQ